MLLVIGAENEGVRSIGLSAASAKNSRRFQITFNAFQYPRNQMPSKLAARINPTKSQTFYGAHNAREQAQRSPGQSNTTTHLN
jgi:hypothetical protein